MINPESKRPVTVEDLLRLKGAERPGPEFWTEFDRQLRAKQLSALVAKRPWWQQLPSVRGWSRYSLPLGAAAIVAVTFVSVREYRDVGSVDATPVDAVTMRASNADTPATAGVVSALPMAANVLEQRGEYPVSTVARLPDNSTASGARTESSASSTSLVFADLVRSTELSAHAVGGSLAMSSATEATATRSLLVPATGFEDRVFSTRASVEPLQQITPPSERSRAKLLTAMLSMASAEAPTRHGERVASKLSEERLYDQTHRFGARGAGVSMKF